MSADFEAAMAGLDRIEAKAKRDRAAIEEMHSALLDIMAFWMDDEGHSDYDAGELMYQRATEALRKVRP